MNETDRDYLRQAYWAAEHRSDDPDTQNGAVLVCERRTVIAANSFPPGVAKTPNRLLRPLKYQLIEHAERRVIYQAARMGIMTEGATLYCPWFACHDCARAIISAGITRVVGHEQVVVMGNIRGLMDPTWKQSIEIGNMMLIEAGVQLDYYDGEIGECEVLFDGKLWRP